MTRLAIIADVHGNLPALKAVIAAVGDVDGWICAGDVAGHLPFVDETAACLRTLGAHCVKGNHDAALVEGYGIPGSTAATRALQLQRTYVTPGDSELACQSAGAARAELWRRRYHRPSWRARVAIVPEGIEGYGRYSRLC